MKTKKITVTLLTVIVFSLVLGTSAFATLNCGGGSFDRAYDTGTIMPYDDAKAYTKCTAAYHFDVNNSKVYRNTGWVRCELTYIGSSGTPTTISGYDGGSSEQVYDTGWITASGYDNATKIRYTGDVDCTFISSIDGACTGHNSLDVTQQP